MHAKLLHCSTEAASVVPYKPHKGAFKQAVYKEAAYMRLYTNNVMKLMFEILKWEINI